MRTATLIQNISGLTQGPADPAPGKLEDAASRLSRGSRWPVYDGGGAWGGSRMIDLRRRDFITLLGGAAAWPMAARAQQPVALVGFLSSISAADRPHHTEAFRQGLNETGYAEARNVTIEYRYADNRMDQLRPLAADLIARKVAVIAAVAGNNTALVAKTLT